MTKETLSILHHIRNKKNISKLDLMLLLCVYSVEHHISELIKHGYKIIMTKQNGLQYYKLEEN